MQLGTKMNLLDFDVRRSEVRGQGYNETMSGQISLLGCIYSPVHRTHGHILTKLNVYHYHFLNRALHGPGRH